MLIVLALLTFLFGISTKMNNGLAQANGTPAPELPLPPPPPVPGQPLGPLELEGPTLQLIPKASYLAKIHLTGLQSLFGTAGAVKSKLAELGFSPVSVWQGEAVPDFFPDRVPEVDGSTYWAAGTYSSKPQDNLKRPGAVKRMWVLPLGATPPVVGGGVGKNERLVELQKMAREVRRAIETIQDEDEGGKA